ncbi:Williams-Beuren syndrome chromosome region 16 protein [Rhizopus azygosporus]|uniref:Williams-Beuren syndrome chromosome region 16 protein n=1 Tax=Rhizopus azygosporus TaxID=86630 RepID=A0A367JD69_RHIAZ|nr:Williams-Beuren syndrome chromosome region 16 protein [Rhizopus azygosporus]
MQRLNRTVLYGWGQTQALPLLKGSMDRVLNKPQLLKQLDDYALPKDETVTHLATGWGHSLLGTDMNSVYSFGLNKSGQLGNGNISNQGGSKIYSDKENKIKFLACGREHSHVVTEKDKKTQLYSFGNNMYGQLGIGKNKNTVPGELAAESTLQNVKLDGVIEHIVCGLDNTVLATDHHVYAMGWGADGQLGQGCDDKDIPSQVSIDCSIKKLSSSTDFTLLLTNKHTLWTWGNSEYGQGMQGKKIDRILEPLKVNMGRVMDVAAGGPFSIVLTEDGHVYSCGYGALGLGPEMIESLELKEIKGLEKVVKVYASTDYAAALTEDGQLYTWGLNGPSGRLGLGHHEHAFVPNHVNVDRKVLDVSLGVNHAMILCEDV